MILRCFNNRYSLKKMILFITCLVQFTNVALSLIQEDVIPPELNECYKHFSIAQRSNYKVRSNCIQKYIYNKFGSQYFDILDENAWKWIESLSIKTHQIVKRQVGYKRRRKEIRTLSDKERQRCFSAINALKRDRVSKTERDYVL